MRISVVLGISGLAALASGRAVAQQAAAPAAPAAAAPAAGTPVAAAPASPGKSLGMIIYPAKGQDAATQTQDEQQCYVWAKDQTGIDPAAVKANPDSAAKAAQARVDSAAAGIGVKGAARGAVGGAAVSAITGGDAGDGAAIGAAAGAVAGRRAKKAAKAEAGAQAAEASKQQAAALIDKFKKAMGTCMSGRGYTVS